MRKTLRALLLALAILLPASALAIYGLRAYRAEALLLRERYSQDQAAIVRLVADRVSETARKALEDLEERCRRDEPDAVMEERFIAAHPLVRHIFLIRDGRLVYPTPTPTPERPARPTPLDTSMLPSNVDIESYVGRLRESRWLARWLASGLKLEHSGRTAAAAEVYARVRGRRNPLAAEALLGEARLHRRLGRPEAAAQSYRTLRQRFGGQQDSEGVSFGLLADAGLAEVGPRQHLLGMHAGLIRGDYNTSAESRRFYLRWSVEQLTRRPDPDPAAGSRQTARLFRSTAHLFASEQFADSLLRTGVFELQQLATSRIEGVLLDRRNLVVIRERGAVIAGYALNEDRLRGQVAGHRREVVPPGGGIQLSLDRLGETPHPRDRSLHASVLAPPLGNWTLTALRPSADPMALLERRQGMRHQALALGLILVLVLGIVLTYLGVRRESELARLKSDFASNVSHELKTPLTSIRMYAEMLQEGIAATPVDRDRYQQVIIRESERLGRLIANVLDFSRLERGTRLYELRAADLEELTGEALETFGRLSEGERISSRFSVEAQLAPVMVDREAALQSILNLLSNAAKYSPDRPRIEVELRAGNGEMAVLVRDQGIGIPASEQKKIFDDFYRAPGARRAGVEGTGLGLALVRRHMAACGGRVELRSAPGRGSEFTLWFKAAPAEGEQPRRDRARTPAGITLHTPAEAELRSPEELAREPATGVDEEPSQPAPAGGRQSEVP